MCRFTQCRTFVLTTLRMPALLACIALSLHPAFARGPGPAPPHILLELGPAPMHHSLLQKGGQAGPLKQGQARWFPTSKTPSEVLFLNRSKPAKRLKNRDWEHTMKVIEVIRGKVKVGREIKTRHFAVKLNLLIGDVSDTDHLWKSTIIALEYTSLADSR